MTACDMTACTAWYLQEHMSCYVAYDNSFGRLLKGTRFVSQALIGRYEQAGICHPNLQAIGCGVHFQMFHLQKLQ